MKTAEYEFYHGVVLHRICSALSEGVGISTFDFSGRLDTFRLNDAVAIHIKHSTARITPWQFTFNSDSLRELIEVRKRLQDVYIALVCGDDGIVTLTLEEFVSASEMRPGGAVPIRVSRDRNKMYKVTGNLGEVPRRKREGVLDLISAARAALSRKVENPLLLHTVANSD